MARHNIIGGFFEDYDLVEEKVQTIVAQHNLLEICRCEQNDQVHWIFSMYSLNDSFIYGDRAQRETMQECVVFENEQDCWDAYHESFAQIYEQAQL